MTRIARPKTIEILASSARKFFPSTGWPDIPSKKKLMVTCSHCGWVTGKSWDQLSNLSVNEHCNCCSGINILSERFMQEFLLKSIKIVDAHFSSLEETTKSTNRGVCNIGIEFTLKLPCSCLVKINRERMRYVINRQSLECIPKCLHEHASSKADRARLIADRVASGLEEACKLQINAKNTLGEGCVVTFNQGNKSIEDFSYNIYIPAFSISSEIHGVRVADFIGGCLGSIKGELTAIMSKKQLIQEINRCEKLQRDITELSERASCFGVTLTHIYYVPPKLFLEKELGYVPLNSPPDMPKARSGYYIRYRSTSGIYSVWHSISKLKDPKFVFSRSDIKQAQLLVLCVLKTLFPFNEHGEETIWVEDSRSLLGDTNYEIDISTSNLLPELGGIRAEYDGHQSHRDDSDTKDVDSKKKGYLSGLFLRIPPLPSYSSKSAYSHVLKIINNAAHQEKNVFVELMKIPNSIKWTENNIGRLFSIESRKKAMFWQRRLDDKINDTGRKLAVPIIYAFPGTALTYICPICKNISDTTVKQFCESRSSNCKWCMNEAKFVRNESRRREDLIKGLDPEIMEKLTGEQTEQLIQLNPHCPKCAHPYYTSTAQNKLNRLVREKGFVCFACLNTGENQLPASGSTGIGAGLTTKLPLIFEVLKTFSYDTSLWFEAISYDDTPQIVLTVFCDNRHELSYTISKWSRLMKIKARKREGNFCPDCVPIKGKQRAPSDILAMVQLYHPDAKIIAIKHDKDAQVFHCGQFTHSSSHNILHHTFLFPTRTRSDRKIITNQSINERESYCMACAVMQDRKFSGMKKSSEQITKYVIFLCHIFKDLSGLALDVDSLELVIDGKKIGFLLKNNTGETYKWRPQTVSNLISIHKKGFFPQLMKNNYKNVPEMIKAYKTKYQQL